MPILMNRSSEAEFLEDGTVIEHRKNIMVNLLDFYEGLYMNINLYNSSKYEIMNAVGKLLSQIRTIKPIDWGKVKGYVLNTVRNQQSSISQQMLESLNESLDSFSKVRDKINGISWVRFIDGIDYDFFYEVFQNHLKGQTEYILKKFQEYLKDQYNDIKKIREVLELSEIEDFKDIPHPSEVEKKEIINNFWNYYQKNKKTKGGDKDKNEQ
jgi:hypothetical protein